MANIVEQKRKRTEINEEIAYDIKFRKQAVEYKKAGHSVEKTLSAFGISRTTLYKWIKMDKAGNMSGPKSIEWTVKKD